MLKSRKLLLAGLLAVCASAPSMAQMSGTVANIEGQIVAERSGQFYSAQNATALQSGDLLTNSGNTISRITLRNGCSVNLGANQSVRINLSATSCSEAFSSVNTVSAAANFTGTQVSLLQPLGFVAGAIGTVGIVSLVSEIVQDDKPSSP